MKHRVHAVRFTSRGIVVFALAMSAFAIPCRAQVEPTYQVTRFRVAGGGTTSTGGGYAVTGTVGQSEAGAMTGGEYALRSGFWTGSAGVVGVEDPSEAPLPLAFDLHRATPNPAMGSTVMRFDLPHAARARMVVYDAAGRAIRTLVEGTLSAGQHRQAWDGNDDAGRPRGAGVYFVRLEAGSFRASQRIVLLR